MKKIGKYLAVILSSAMTGAFAADPALLEIKQENNRPNAEIILDRNSGPVMEYAANELRKYLGAISGLQIPVADQSAASVPGTVRIVLCLPDSGTSEAIRKQFADDFKSLKNTDGYAVRRDGSRIYLIANCPKGILNGVYRFLMKNTDIVWPRPGGELAIFTPCKTIPLKETDYLDIPAFKYRGWGWNYSRTVWSDEVQTWRAKMGFNTPGGLYHPKNMGRDRKLGFADGFLTVSGGGHNMITTWLPLKEFAEKHPEYYMLVDGKRWLKKDANPCYTNPEVAEVIAGRVTAQLDSLKTLPTIVVVQNADQGLTCECNECLKPIRLADGSLLTKDDEAFRSTQFFLFFNDIARRVAKKYPDVLLQTYGYFFTAIPPKTALEKNILVSFCPYIRNDKEPISGKSNTKWRLRTEDWLKLTPNLIWREYYYSGARFPRPLAEIMGQDLRYIQKKGVPYVTSEFTWSDDQYLPAYDKIPASEFWDLTAVEAWVLSQMLWDPFADPNRLRDDYLNRTFKEAAPEMREFYRLIREAWLNDPAPSAFNDNIVKSFAYYIIKKKIDRKCLAALESAEKKAVNPDSKRLVRAAKKTFLKNLALAKEESSTDLQIPRLNLTETPPADLNSGVWRKAAVFPAFYRMGNRNQKSGYNIVCKMFHDGRNLYLGTTVEKNRETFFTRNQAGQKRDVFPAGDHVEFFFTNARDGYYYHLAYDLRGNRYDAKLTDPSWNPEWEVKTWTSENKWESVAKIPLDTLGVEILKSNKLRALPMITSCDKEQKGENATWGGGIVHSPDSFGELILWLEAE